MALSRELLLQLQAAQGEGNELAVEYYRGLLHTVDVATKGGLIDQVPVPPELPLQYFLRDEWRRPHTPESLTDIFKIVWREREARGRRLFGDQMPELTVVPVDRTQNEID